jgi:hypothetical protein
LTYLYNFTGSDDGFNPIGNLTPASGGFYGSTATTIYWYDASAPPPPYISLQANPNTFTSDRSTVVTWTSTGATSCTASGVWSGAQATSGSQTVSTKQVGNPTLTLTCTGAGGDALVTEILYVNSPPTLTMSVSPSTINAGESANLVWNGTDTDSTCTASGDWSGSQSFVGKQSVTQSSAGTYVYTLTCTSTAGDETVAASTTLVVKDTATNSASESTGGTSHGGGTLGIEELIGLGVLVALRRKRPLWPAEVGRRFRIMG